MHVMNFDQGFQPTFQDLCIVFSLIDGTDVKIVYRHYATLYFVFCVDSSESELGILDLIQVNIFVYHCPSSYIRRIVLYLVSLYLSKTADWQSKARIKINFTIREHFQKLVMNPGCTSRLTTIITRLSDWALH